MLPHIIPVCCLLFLLPRAPPVRRSVPLQSLNQIIVALIRAIPGVFNAFVVMFIFFCIYAILAVELFRDFGNQVSAVDQRPRIPTSMRGSWLGSSPPATPLLPPCQLS